MGHTAARPHLDGRQRQVEQAVGRDLQFIRINGTLIGGCIGVVIYAGARFVLLSH